MFKFEAKFWDFVIKKKDILIFLFITAIAILIRVFGRDYISGDMSGWLTPWYNEIKDGGGINSLSRTIGDQSLLFQTVMNIMTYINFSNVYLIKIFSILFDWVLAFAFAGCVVNILGKKLFGFEWIIGYAMVLLLPTVVLNSAYWGQCDSVYTAFLMLTILCLLKERFFLTFTFFGIALAFKMQAIFILPFLFCYYLYKKKFSFLMFLVPVFVFWSSGIVAYIKGQGLLEAFKIYFGQTDAYHDMFLNFCSFWVFIGNNYDQYMPYAVLFVFLLCILIIYLVLSGKKKFDTSEQIVNTCCWILWTCVLFLPAMHERYAYSLDIFLLLLCFIRKSYIKYAIVAALVSLIVYGKYLGSNEIPYYVGTMFYLGAYLHYSYFILNKETEAENFDVNKHA